MIEEETMETLEEEVKEPLKVENTLGEETMEALLTPRTSKGDLPGVGDGVGGVGDGVGGVGDGVGGVTGDKGEERKRQGVLTGAEALDVGGGGLQKNSGQDRGEGARDGLGRIRGCYC
ncbi:hypothetical protein K439DRAFT_1615315 [Ramaria rubella]|nr:hypothetical protein K439DRAFT_1615315 [Ramaria rubella]